MKLLLYCTKSKPHLHKSLINNKYFVCNDIYLKGIELNGIIVAECDFEVEKIVYDLRMTRTRRLFEEYTTKSLSEKELLNKSCLDMWQMEEYFNGKNGYAIHIRNLHIFDELMGLSEYSKKIEHKKCDYCEEHCKFYYNKNTMSGETNKGCTEYHPIRKAPQNMMYCYDASENKNILISIRPEWLCKILNGEKTIEIRKKVLKEMLNDK